VIFYLQEKLYLFADAYIIDVIIFSTLLISRPSGLSFIYSFIDKTFSFVVI